jgi:hypothetical protein
MMIMTMTMTMVMSVIVIIMIESENLGSCGGGRSGRRGRSDEGEMSEYDSYYGCNKLERKIYIFVYKICGKFESHAIRESTHRSGGGRVIEAARASRKTKIYFLQSNIVEQSKFDTALRRK